MIWDEIARAAGFEPIERQTAWAVAASIYEYAGQPADAPLGLSLAVIGRRLSSRSEEKEAIERTARNRLGQLFNHAIPREGVQILTRYKSAEGKKEKHKYVDHLTPVAAFFSELFAEEKVKILADKTLDKSGRGAAIAAAREQLIIEALKYLRKCDTELYLPALCEDETSVDQDEESYAYVSGPEAQAFMKNNPQFMVRPLKYTPPEEKPRPAGPIVEEDIKRIEDKLERILDQALDDILTRNSFSDALTLAARLRKKVADSTSSWTKVARTLKGEKRAAERDKGINIGGKITEGPADEAGVLFDFEPLEPEFRPENFSGLGSVTPAEINDLQNQVCESVNFDTALEAATFYARDGYPVLPICQWDASNNRCTADWHPAECAGKKPLKKGEGKPGSGYWATKDPAKIRDLWKKYPWAGVGIRLDDHILIDCDLKDGGPESYEFLRDTFDLPETLTAITQGGGRHYVFKLPEGLPSAWLKSWTRVTEKIGLDGIDLKVGVCGLLFAEPTIGAKGVYRWIDPTVEPSTLPRECADFLHEIRYKDEKPQAEKAERKPRVYSSETSPDDVDASQAEYFRDVKEGESRHRRLYNVGCAMRAAGANADQIAKGMRYHAQHFKEPLHDEAYIQRTSAAIAEAF